VRDTIAELKGCIRVVARVRPVIRADFREGSHYRLILHWLVRYALSQSAFRRNPAGPALLCNLVGWPDSFPSFCDALGVDAACARGSVSAEARSSLSTDIAPLWLSSRHLPDASKESMIVPPPMEARVFFDLLDSAPYDMSNTPATLQASLTNALTSDGSSFWFDKVFAPTCSQHDIFQGKIHSQIHFGYEIGASPFSTH
jgi:hypothetical protein